MNKKLKTGLILLLMAGYFTTAFAQADTVVIRVGKDSRVTFLIKDKKDLETLKHYNFQALMDDMVKKLEQRDSTTIAKPSSDYLKDTAKMAPSNPSSIDNWQRDKDDDDDNDRMSNRQRRKQNRRTHHSVNIDIGTNNYLQGGKFPDATNQQYSVKPWGSWYVGINSIMHTRIAKKFFLDWGGGVSWYNFKFDDPTTVLSKDNNGVIFSKDLRNLDFRKSKLTTSYVNVMAVPMIDFGDNGRKSTFFDGHHSSSFRIGVGPYAGYLIDSYTKQMYYDQGEKYRVHNHDNYYLNNIRYGLRLQVGFRDTDLFFNYDMNELFTDNKGPKVQAFSFGITL